jgi:putative addiction module component (TIGR02574 family)
MATQVSMTLEELREKALQLPPHERIELAEDLFESVDDEDPAAVEAAWADEIQRRAEDFDAGRAESSSIADVIGRAREHVKRVAEARLRPR